VRPFRLLRRFGGDQRGAGAVLVALCMPMVLGFGAVAVDLGSVFLTTRHLQGVADMAAMAAANDLAHAQAAADATVAANPMDAPVTAEVITGGYTADGSMAATDRFQAGAASPTAARVILHGAARLFIGGALVGRTSFDISRTATAARAQLASFSIGSRLAAVNGGIENTLLSALTGSSVSLSAMDYTALASANVDLFDYVAALRTRLSLTGASYNQVLSTKAPTSVAMQALADVLNTNGQAQASMAAQSLATAQPSSARTDLSLLINAGPYGDQDHIAGGSSAKVAVSALDFADAIVSVANGGRQVQLNLGAGIPGLASTTAWLAIGQRPSNSPWIGIDSAGTVVVRTAQARLYVDAQVGGGGVLNGLTGGALLHVPAYVELASAEAKLSSLSCANGTVALSVAPSVGRIAIGQVDTSALDDFTTGETIAPATLLNLGLVKATAVAVVDLGGEQWQTVNFSANEVASHTLKSVSTQNLAQQTVSSLVGNAQIGVQLFGLGVLVGQGPVTTALGQALGAAAPPIDSVIDGLESLLGVRLGEADVRINGLRCQGAALVA
jgi:uncharacterized membrane protein